MDSINADACSGPSHTGLGDAAGGRGRGDRDGQKRVQLGVDYYLLLLPVPTWVVCGAEGRERSDRRRVYTKKSLGRCPLRAPARDRLAALLANPLVHGPPSLAA